MKNLMNIHFIFMNTFAECIRIKVKINNLENISLSKYPLQKTCLSPHEMQASTMII